MRALLAGLAVLTLASMAQANSFSFTGSFTQDDNVQLFNFVVGAPSTVTLRTWSYAGGTNAAGNVIAPDGFDPILALFDGTGALINQNDDGGVSVPADPETGAHFDTFLSSSLAAGTYTVAVMEFNNFAIGPNLSNGFRQTGNGNFTGPLTGHTGAFWDVTSDQNDGHWAFDILNVTSATTSNVPEPGSIAMVFTALLSFGVFGGKLRT